MSTNNNVNDKISTLNVVEKVMTAIRSWVSDFLLTITGAVSELNEKVSPIVDGPSKANMVYGTNTQGKPVWKTGGAFYGTCDIAASTAVKTVTVGDDFSLVQGAIVYVKMTNTNSAANPTLNVNNTGAKAIRRYGTTVPSTTAATSWNTGAIVQFIYDGEYWYIEGWINDDTNTTYSAMSTSELTTGTATTTRTVRADYLKAGIETIIKNTVASSGSSGKIPVDPAVEPTEIGSIWISTK